MEMNTEVSGKVVYSQPLFPCDIESLIQKEDPERQLLYLNVLQSVGRVFETSLNCRLRYLDKSAINSLKSVAYWEYVIILSRLADAGIIQVRLETNGASQVAMYKRID